MPFPPTVPTRVVTGRQRWTLPALIVWAAVGATAISLLAQAQAGSRRDAEQRFALRATIASRFVTTYVRDLIDRQSATAVRHLAGPSVSQRRFATTARDSGFSAGLLLDREGRVVRSLPHDPAVVGNEVGAKHAHLRAGMAGRTAITGVVPSVVEGIPVVAFVVPFDTPSGRRIYSGAYDIATTPVGAYLRNAIPVPSSRLYLVDDDGAVIADNRKASAGVQTLAGLEPGLEEQATARPEGGFTAPGGDQRYVTAAIAGTPWRVVVTAPASTLYESSSGTARWLPWGAVLGFLLASLFAVLLLLRYLHGRADLARLVSLLEKVVRIDPLTDLYNRRGLDEQLSRAVSQSRRHEHPLTVMLIDVDHFKRANDRWGHQAGDRILAALGDLMRDALRAQDVLGRWGGEEFLAILPDTAGDDAAGLAERLRSAIAAEAIELPDGSTATVTVSIGLACSVDGTPDERIGAADRALYAAKAAGRNRVEHGRGPVAAVPGVSLPRG